MNIELLLQSQFEMELEKGESMLNKQRIIASLLVLGIFAVIGALSPVTARRHWVDGQGLHGLAASTFNPIAALPLSGLRGPAMAQPVLQPKYASSQKINLNDFFGFDLNEIQNKESFPLKLEDQLYEIKKKSFEQKGDGYFTWMGYLNGNENHVMVLTYLNGYAGANINGPAGVYSIQYEHGRHLLKKFDRPQ